MDIKSVTESLNIKIVIPEGNSLERVNGITASREDNGTILFNIKPLFHFNIVHYALLNYLKVFTENNFKCTIILQDLITTNGDFLDEINTQKEAIDAMNLLFERIKKYKINLENIEIIPESGLLRLYNRGKRKFFFDLIKLSSISDKENISSITTNSFEHIDSLCCFLYETFIIPEFVITGGNELNTVWHKLRKRGSLDKLMGNEYSSPIMLVVPDIYKHNNEELISTLDKDDPFYEHYNTSKINITNLKYAELITSLNKKVKLLVSENPNEIIAEFKSIVY